MLEVCIDSLESAINAVHGGADELEVCSSLIEGGLTPSVGLVKNILEMVQRVGAGTVIHNKCAADCGCSRFEKRPRVNVMLRCRNGSDFQYNNTEMDTMLADLEYFKLMTVDRFVFGALTQTGEIDVVKCKRIVHAAYPITVTFHRAFDLCSKPLSSLETIIDLGFNRVLASGQEDSADKENAIKLIESFVSSSNERIEIMSGAGVNASNVKLFAEIGCRIVHASCKTKVLLPTHKNKVSMGDGDKEFTYVTSRESVQNLIQNFKRIMS